jgi:hypothetical protein
MGNELKVQNSLVVAGPAIISGSLTTIGGLVASGSFNITGSLNITNGGLDVQSATQTGTGTALNILNVGYSNSTIGIVTGSAFLVSTTANSSNRYTTTLRVGGGSDTSAHYLRYGEGNANGLRLDRSNSTLGIFTGNGVYISNTDTDITPSARLQVRGSGATSSTTALRVENASASPLLTILDDGTPTFHNNLIVSGTIFYRNLSFGDFTLNNSWTDSVNSNSISLYDSNGNISIVASPSLYNRSIILRPTSVYGSAGVLIGPYTTGNGTIWPNILNVSGSSNFIGNTIITGSLTVVTGSSVKFQVNQTGVKIGNTTTDSHSITGSIAISSSASTSSAALQIYKSGSTVLDIQGSQGQLFSVIDVLSGSLMSVNDISGLPILEVFSDDRVVLGTYGAPALIITGSNAVFTGSVVIDGALLDTIRTGSLATGSTLIYTVNTGSYQAGFFDYYVNSGSNFRAGNIMAVFGAGTYRFTDAATPDIGDTTNLQFSMSMAGASAQLYASASTAGWTVKTTFRTI